eukprot:TRINITY_DN6228_c0_g1_i2.p1 TRINITY_DN6228_c0_g1~~TRINITY_DN6228_c0_g1_i2.p1  ORF type:complete len:1554 (+),score=479.95 TRINITY_DN6228_c0_g1_i2:38-4699(+)
MHPPPGPAPPSRARATMPLGSPREAVSHRKESIEEAIEECLIRCTVGLRTDGHSDDDIAAGVAAVAARFRSVLEANAERDEAARLGVLCRDTRAELENATQACHEYLKDVRAALEAADGTDETNADDNVSHSDNDSDSDEDSDSDKDSDEDSNRDKDSDSNKARGTRKSVRDATAASLANPEASASVAPPPPSAPPRVFGSDVRTRFSMLSFMMGLGAPDSVTQYGPARLMQLLLKCIAMLESVKPKVTPEAEWVRNAAAQGVGAADLVDRVIAAFIYSVDGKECRCTSLAACKKQQLLDSAINRKHRVGVPRPADTAALGWDGTHWAVMNWAFRVNGDDAALNALKEGSKKLVKRAVGFFAPLAAALNDAVAICPSRPRIVFRGLSVAVAQKYKLGTPVRFDAFTSTSLVGSEAMSFMKGTGPSFVISSHSGGLIADFSHYPEQAESLLATGRRFVVTAKVSRTLLQMLGHSFDVVFMAEEGSTLDDAARIAQLVAGLESVDFIYSKYIDSIYVQGKVSETPPPPPEQLDSGDGDEAEDEHGASSGTDDGDSDGRGDDQDSEAEEPPPVTDADIASMEGDLAGMWLAFCSAICQHERDWRDGVEGMSRMLSEVDGEGFDELLAESRKYFPTAAHTTLRKARRILSRSDGAEAEPPCLKLYKATEHFVMHAEERCLLLLGTAGTGKTSALVGALCSLVRLKSAHVRPLLPIFVSLPAVGETRLRRERGLDEYVRELLNLPESAFALLKAEARVVLLLDSLDEVAPGDDGTPITSVYFLSAAMNPWAASVKCIVSCRPEALDGRIDFPKHTEESRRLQHHGGRGPRVQVRALSGEAGATQVYYVQEFGEAEQRDFVVRASQQDMIRLANKEADRRLKGIRETFSLGEEELANPCVLKIATEVVGKRSDDMRKLVPRGVVPNRFTLYELFASGFVEGLDEDAEEAVRGVLTDVACAMFQQREWHLTVGALRGRLAEALAESPHSSAVNAIVEKIPCRCQDLYDDAALWGFWHKTIAEYFVARATAAQSAYEIGFLKKSLPVAAAMAHMAANTSAQRAVPPFPSWAGWCYEVEMRDVTQSDGHAERSLQSLQKRHLRCLTEGNYQKWVTELDLSALVFDHQGHEGPEGSGIGWSHVGWGWVAKAKDESVTLPVRHMLQEHLREFEVLEKIVLPVFPGVAEVGLHVQSGAHATDAEGSTKVGFLHLVLPDSIRRIDMAQSFPDFESFAPRFLDGAELEGVAWPAAVAEMTAVPDAFLNNVSFEGGYDLFEDFVASFPKVTTIGQNFMAGVKLQEHRWNNMFKFPADRVVESIDAGFLAGVKHLKSLQLPSIAHYGGALGELLLCSPCLEFGEWFGTAQDLGTVVENAQTHVFSQLRLPEFRAITAVPDQFLRGVRFNNHGVGHLNCVLPKATSIGDDFLAETSAQAEGFTVTIDAPNVTTVGRGFLRGAKQAETTFAPKALSGVRDVGDDFCAGFSGTVTNLPAFASVARVPAGFFAEAALQDGWNESQKLNLSHAFGAATSVGDRFCAKVTKVTYPEFKNVEKKPEGWQPPPGRAQ